MGQASAQAATKKRAFQIVHDSGAEVPVQIAMYFHCTRCLDEKPDGISPKDFARQQVGVTKEGYVQVVCTRHDLNVDLMTFVQEGSRGN